MFNFDVLLDKHRNIVDTVDKTDVCAFLFTRQVWITNRADLSRIMPGSNCREYRESGAIKLMKKVVNGAWNPSKIICCLSADDPNVFILVDGRHRIEMIKMLSNNQYNRIFGQKGVLLYVYTTFTEEEQLAISCACNDSHDTFVEMSFFDKMFALKKGRDMVMSNADVRAQVINKQNQLIVSSLATAMINKGLSVGYKKHTCRVALTILELVENDSCWNYLKGIFKTPGLENCITYSAISHSNIKGNDCFKKPFFMRVFLERVVAVSANRGTSKNATNKEVDEIATAMVKSWQELTKVDLWCAQHKISATNETVVDVKNMIMNGSLDLEIEGNTENALVCTTARRLLKNLEASIAQKQVGSMKPSSAPIETSITEQPSVPVVNANQSMDFSFSSSMFDASLSSPPDNNSTFNVNDQSVMTLEGMTPASQIEKESIGPSSTNMDSIGERTVEAEVNEAVDVSFEDECNNSIMQLQTLHKMIGILGSPIIRSRDAEAVAANVKQLCPELWKWVKFFNMPFTEFATKMSDTLRNKAQLVYCDPPYNILKMDRDFISTNDMKVMVESAMHILKPNGTLWIWCAWQQANQWQNLMIECGLGIHKALITLVNHSTICKSSRGGSTFTNVTQYAVVGYKKSEVAYKMNVRGNPKFLGGYHGTNTNVILNYIPPRFKLTNSEGKVLVPEQKSIALNQEVYSRFCVRGDMVVDFFGGSGGSAIAALKSGLLFAGCERDKEIFKYANMSILQMFHEFQKGGKHLW